MKIKDRLEKMLENEDDALLYSDVFLLGAICRLIEEIDDIKLQKELREACRKIHENFLERDLEEEAKTEFYCQHCDNFKGLKEQSPNDKYLCRDCEVIEKANEDCEVIEKANEENYEDDDYD